MDSLASQIAHDGVGAFFFDPSARSRALCKLGIVVSWLAGLTSLILGIWLVKDRGGAYLTLARIPKEVVPLALNVGITCINETLGYIHTNSLRWALQREGRLTFNSNLRLFTSARTSKANAWYSNIAMLLGIVMSYASSSLVFMEDVPLSAAGSGVGKILPDNVTTFVCGYTVLTLGMGILGQCVVATAALRSAVQSPTWSPSPIDTAAACACTASVKHVSGRCLRSVHEQSQAPAPVHPSHRQQYVFGAHHEVRFVLYWLWSTVGLSLLWGVVLIAVIRNGSSVNGIYYGHSWSFFPYIPDTVNLNLSGDRNRDASGTMTLAIPWNVIGQFSWQNTKDPYVSFPSFCWAFALACLLQAIMTLSLHCAELLVNVVRDEQMWRRAGDRTSTRRYEPGLPRAPMNALHALLFSGPAMTLFLLKPILHWMYGLAVSTYFSVGLVMHPPQIFYLSVGAVLLALMVSTWAFWQPKGPQPATFGHLQTLMDVIDEWPGPSETMFWGRKAEPRMKRGEDDQELLLPERGGPVGGNLVAHAGTSSVSLDEVNFDEAYMGTGIVGFHDGIAQRAANGSP